MSDLLPLFPVHVVLFPGTSLVVHVFEERYRLLVSELLEGPAPRRFGIVAIRAGRDVGNVTPELCDVGCVAEVRRVEPFADGRYDVSVLGGPRFELVRTDDRRPYLVGSVRYLPEPAGDDPVEAAKAVHRAFRAYGRAVATATGRPAPVTDLPSKDPALTSWLVATALHLDLPEKQSLLEAPDTTSRLHHELDLLRRETALLERTPATPAVAPQGPFSLN